MMARRTERQPPVTPRLAEYRSKRDFGRTGEPRGKAESSDSGRMFCVQKHAARNLHYDLRLEFDGVLKSWALPRGPSLDPKQKPLAVEVEDHPIEYGVFEGIIPKGEYGGGTVMLWDRGSWEPLGDPADGYRKGDLKFVLHGDKLNGAWVLARMGGRGNEDGRNWLLIKKRDDAAQAVERYNVLGELPRSVLSGRSLEEIAADPDAVWSAGGEQLTDTGRRRRRGKRPAATRRPRDVPDAGKLPGARRSELPPSLRPQLATPVSEAPEGDEWLHEIKLDGYRLIARREGKDVTLLTRNGHDWTDRFGEVARALLALPVERAFLDGEVVVLDAEGISDFQALQNAFRGYTSRRFTYYLFDVPWAEGYDLTATPLVERKAYLERVLAAAPAAAPVIQFCEHITGTGPVVHEQAARANLEGIISKRVESSYEPGRRSASWLKVKCTLCQEFVVGGFSVPMGSRSGFGALLLGQHDDEGRLVYRGRVGTGFSEQTLEEMARQLRVLERESAPFSNPEADPQYKQVSWVHPELVCEVEFTAWTGEGLVRHATWRGQRFDADPAEVVREQVEVRLPAGRPRARVSANPGVPVGRVVKAPRSPDDAFVAGVRISHPARTVYPDDGVTKLQVAEYYHAVAERALPHLVGRPLSLVRCPLGLAGQSFYQRHLGEGFPAALRPVDIGESEEGPGIVIRDLAGLLSLVQMGVLEIHPWGCRADNLEKPDRLIFDLDPGSGIEWEHVVASARVVRDALADLGLESFVKTSGGKGLHVVVPLVRRSGWDEVKSFAAAVVQSLVNMAPMNFVATMAKSMRANRIYLDYLRNQRTATAVGAYSTRARTGATASTPLSWDELSPARGPERYTVRTVPERNNVDPWEGFFEVRQSITAKMVKRVTK